MWAIVFNGKLETENPDAVLEKFKSVLEETASDFIGRIERYQLAEYVDYQKVEPINVKENGSETKGTQDSNI